MSQLNSQNPKQSADIVQRRPSDALWFTVLVASIGVGLGMTIFAPVGDDAPPSPTMVPTTAPTTTPAPIAPTQPATSSIS